jgi:hypothetical protein
MNQRVNRQRRSRDLGLVLGILSAAPLCLAQELEPRAYSISPTGVNFFVVGFARSSGGISFDPNLPIEDARATLHQAVIAYGRSLNFFGRSANVAVQSPYVWGPLQGTIDGQLESTRRSGLAPPAVRFAVNLYGGPAMDREQFSRYQRRTLIGTSFAFAPPLGQYDPNRLINISSNRWAFKQEVGISHRVRRWYFDAYLGAWLFADNNHYQGRVRSQDPIGSAQFHLSYSFKPRLWAAFNANFYVGGRSAVDEIRRYDLQRNSRVGGTLAIPITSRQSLKCSISTGARTTIGASFTSVAVGYQFLWGAGF